MLISIHVPTKGTTLHHFAEICTKTISIHVPTKGTTTVDGCVCETCLFQSTYPRRVRHNEPKYPKESPHFNPRTHEGYDLASMALFSSEKRFQSTYPRRVRLVPSVKYSTDVTISIHVPTKGTTNYGLDNS